MFRRTAFICLWLALAVTLPCAAAGSGPQADALPQLISTGPEWKNLEELRQFAERGHPQACFELADRLIEGDGVPQDSAQARVWFQRAADGGVADAWFRLGKLHHDGMGVPQDYAQAFEFFSVAARRGVPEAQHNIGAMLVSARGVKRDYVEGLAWLIVAGKSGAESAAEQQVRDRLQRRPRDIEKAEARAAELLAAMQESAAGAQPRATPAEPAISPAPPAFVPSRTPPPKVDIGVPSRPDVAPPKITVPAPGKT